MSDLLLTHGYFLGEDPKEQAIMKPYPPLGLLYLSAFSRRGGFDVAVSDSTFGSREALYARLESAGPGVLGVYTNLMTRASVVRLIGKARELGWTVVVGGPESANYPAEYLDQGAHVVVEGEGEEVADLMGRCRAFVMPGVEDFGIALVEAQAAGAPVIALGEGGALETVIAGDGPGATGVFFGSATSDALVAAVRAFEARALDPAAPRANALRFTHARFLDGMTRQVERVLTEPPSAGRAVAAAAAR